MDEKNIQPGVVYLYRGSTGAKQAVVFLSSRLYRTVVWENGVGQAMLMREYDSPGICGYLVAFVNPRAAKNYRWLNVYSLETSKGWGDTDHVPGVIIWDKISGEEVALHVEGPWESESRQFASDGINEFEAFVEHWGSILNWLAIVPDYSLDLGSNRPMITMSVAEFERLARRLEGGDPK